MTEKIVYTAKTSAELINALRHRYAGSRQKTPEECPFAEQAIAYALEELTPDAQQTMEEHLENCSGCIDLVLDARTAEIESREQAKRPPIVLPALSDAISGPQRSSLVEKIFGGTLMTLRIIAAPAAVVCLMFIVSRLDVLDNINFTVKPTRIAEWSRPVSNEISSGPAATPKKAKSKSSETRFEENTAAVNSFTTHEGWSIDPFQPAIGGESRTAPGERSKPRTPLEAMEPAQLKLVGVMLSDKGNKALVEDASGKGYVVREGTLIGANAGRVSEILNDRVIIEEQIEDAYGKIYTRKRVLKISKP